MKIACPSCATQFGVPDSAFAGGKARALKCARCGHKWHQEPPPELAAGLAFEATPAPLPEPDPEPVDLAPAPPIIEPEQPLRSEGIGLDLDLDLDEEPPPAAPAPAPAASGGGAMSDDLDDSAEDEDEMPDIFGDRPEIPRAVSQPTRAAAPPKPKASRGTVWRVVNTLLVVVLIVGALAGAAYVFQDRLIAVWPGAREYLTALGMRERIGAGLEFRRYDKPELRGDTLIVSGIIANVTDSPRQVPHLRLALIDGPVIVQSKIEPPPSPELGPGETVSFVIRMEKVDPTAKNLTLEFTEAPEGPQG